jgi:hypothetical protein
MHYVSCKLAFSEIGQLAQRAMCSSVAATLVVTHEEEEGRGCVRGAADILIFLWIDDADKCHRSYSEKRLLVAAGVVTVDIRNKK